MLICILFKAKILGRLGCKSPLGVGTRLQGDTVITTSNLKLHNWTALFQRIIVIFMRFGS